MSEIQQAILKFNRNDVKKAIRQLFITKRPELLVRFSNKIVTETEIYLRGYSHALTEYIREPYTVEEIQSFLYDRGFDYAVQRIEEA